MVFPKTERLPKIKSDYMETAQYFHNYINYRVTEKEFSSSSPPLCIKVAAHCTVYFLLTRDMILLAWKT